MSLLKAWLKELPDPGPDPKAPADPAARGLGDLVEFINRKREGQNKKTEAERRRREAALKIYEKVKRGA